MKEVCIFVLFTFTVNLYYGAILMPGTNTHKLKIAHKPVERNLLSFVSTEEKNQKYEIARFQRLLNNYMHTLTQKQHTTKQFLDNLDEEDREVEDKFSQAKKAVKSMKDDALNQIDGTMTTLGIGLS